MSIFHLEAGNVSRGKKQSLAGFANYITGERLHDSYRDMNYCRDREDVLYYKVFLPRNAPPDLRDLQYLCDKIEEAEKRKDARTARTFTGALPNELPLEEQVRIVGEFVNINFVEHGLCAIAAIHEGEKIDDPSRNNPHVHIAVSTRAVGPDGFNKKKDREHNNRKYIHIWRERWAAVQNRAYQRNRLDIRVSHKSLEAQGIDREPTSHISRIDWQREQQGERTPAGDRKREIEARNQERERQQQLKRKRGPKRSR